MNISRRNFLSGIAALGAMSAVPAFSAADNADIRTSATGKKYVERADSCILPPALRSGSRIGIVAPASGVNKKDLEDGIKTLESYGCKVELGKSIGKNHGYLAATDEERAAELNNFIARKDIDAIICARGGYGVMRILPLIDFEEIRKNPKIIMGFSDITALVNAIYLRSKVIAFHGPVASSTFDAFTKESFHKTLFTSSAAGEISESQEFNSIEFAERRLVTLSEGTARGRLVGGNLSLVVGTLGTPYEIQTDGAILFLEEVSEEPYRIDRMLTHLWLAGKLQKCKAIALGRFKNCEKVVNPSFSVSFSLEEVLRSRIASLGIPAVYGLPIGHVRSKMTVPIGTMAELDATHGKLTLVEPSVTI